MSGDTVGQSHEGAAGVRGERHASGRSGSERAGSDHGKTVIADPVVAKIVGIAAREVRGVYAMGTGAARAFDAVRERIPGVEAGSVTQGVDVEVGEHQAAADLNVVVDYGVSISDLATGIRRNVIAAVEKMCGLEVTEVNITVDDIHLPDGSSDDDVGQRVQ